MTSSVLEWCDGKNIETKYLLKPSELDPSKRCGEILMKVYGISLNIHDNKYEPIFDYVLSEILKITNSEVGGICEKIIDGRDEFLKFISVSIHCDKNHKFHMLEMDNLLGRSISYSRVIISNNIKNDIRAKSCPEGHFKIERFVGIPLIVNNTCIGQIILANKNAEYTEDDIYNLYPLIQICADTIFSIHYKKKYTITDMLEAKSNISKAKDDFLATMSHEIRTPLTGIMGAISLLPGAGPLTLKQQEHIKIAASCSIQLLDLINGILDFSRLSSNTLTLVQEPFDIHLCIEETINIVKTQADSKDIKLDIKLAHNIPQHVIGDSKRLKQILVNLFSNAIKFTNKGNIHLEVSAEKIEEQWKIFFSLTDTGIGISRENQSKIFVAFSQVENQTAYNKQDGAGLGLAISRELIELMGGKIEVQSEGRGKGSTFNFTIQVEEYIDIKEILKKHKDLIKEINVLNVDDKDDNLLILDEMLYRWGVNSTMCHTAKEALRYLDHGRQFDLAIIDIYMPYMSGIELAQQLREKYPHIPIIGISSVGKAIQGEEWFDAYLCKPYNQSAILKSMIQCLTMKNRPVKERRKSPKKIRTKDTLKILIADDDVNAQFMISEMIKSLGFPSKNISIVDNGEKCVSLTREQEFDIILMDIKMPIMDGLEASRHIKSFPDHPAIIAVSAGVLDSDKNMYLHGGMDGYLGKPFTTNELDTVLKSFIK